MSAGTKLQSGSRGLFLDLDGTLADSLGVMREVYEGFIRSFGKQPSEAEFQSLNGPPLAQIIVAIKETHALSESVDALHGQYLAQIEVAHKKAPLTTGAIELVTQASNRGWAIAVVTSAHKASAHDWLNRNGMSGFITELVGGDDVTTGKPNPEPYLKALAHTSCDPHQSFAVEDSRAGAVSATSAGLKTFVLAPADDRSGWPQNVIFLNSLSEMLDRLDHVKN